VRRIAPFLHFSNKGRPPGVEPCPPSLAVKPPRAVAPSFGCVAGAKQQQNAVPEVRGARPRGPGELWPRVRQAGGHHRRHRSEQGEHLQKGASWRRRRGCTPAVDCACGMAPASPVPGLSRVGSQRNVRRECGRGEPAASSRGGAQPLAQRGPGLAAPGAGIAACTRRCAPPSRARERWTLAWRPGRIDEPGIWAWPAGRSTRSTRHGRAVDAGAHAAATAAAGVAV
jgi:hypothetical protein